MKYDELESSQKQHVNGVLSKFMDIYVRTHLVWTPEQMYSDLYEKINKNHKEGYYGSQKFVDGMLISHHYEENKWITSVDAKEYILDKFHTKYITHQKLAKKKSPMLERVRFGIRHSEKFYDINYGLKNGSDYEKADVVQNLNITPWSINHVEDELLSKYGNYIPSVFSQLCNSPIEIAFYNEWLERYYSNINNPALIPEFCGSRSMYYCNKDIYGRYSFEASEDSKNVNVRFDFAVINVEKQKRLLIELDGHDYHKTKDQRLNDSIKRTIATNNGWQLNVITGSQIHRNIKEVFDMMSDYFTSN